MRLWSLHPKYLDAKGLVACWREGLLAQKVLLGETKGYKNHPQLERFRDCGNVLDSLEAISTFLTFIHRESRQRGYRFDYKKIKYHTNNVGIRKIPVTEGQLNYEYRHLMQKLKKRDLNKCLSNMGGQNVEPHPLFKVIEGDIESWEKYIKLHKNIID